MARPNSGRAMRPRIRVEDPGLLIRRLLGYIGRKYLIQCVVVVLCVFVSVFAMVQSTLFTKTLIDDYITPLLLSEAPDFAPLAAAIVQVGMFCACGILAALAQQLVLVCITQGTLRSLRNDLFAHMQKLPIRYFDTHSHGDVMSIYTNDIDTLRQMISQSLPQMLNSAISIVSVLVSMLVLNLPLTLVSLAMIAVMLICSKKLIGLSGTYFLKQQRDIGTVNGYIEEMMDGQKVVKVFCHEEQAKAEFKVRNDQLFDSAYNANRFANAFFPVVIQLGNLSYVVCAVVGGIMALSGFWGFTLGGLVSFLAFNKSINSPIGQISQQLNSVVMALAGADRIFRLLDEEVEEDEGSVTLVNACYRKDGALDECGERTGLWAWKVIRPSDGTVEYIPLKGHVTFDHVDFGYTPEKTVLHDITMYAQPGQKIAFVGSTGAGKTTITNLINRFYDIQEGTILYDGVDIRKICKDDLRRSLGMVLQDTHLFTGTVMENIRFGRLDATDEECIAAAQLANADGFIRRLPDGYDTVLTGDGASLSQGQRQLLSIARAAVADPPVLILDEATSSIDTRTEKIVQDGMDALMTGRTTFVIAHRLSTIRNSDCIMVLEQGRIIERGSHEQLLEEQGRYYQLYTGNRPAAGQGQG